MEFVKASIILDDAYRLIGWDADNLETRDEKDARASLSRALQTMWEAWFWGGLMVTARTQFAPTWGAGNATPAVYDPNTDWYYLQLLATTNPPIAADNTANTAFGWCKWEPDRQRPAWALSSQSAYVVGSQVCWLQRNWQWWSDDGTAPATETPGDALGIDRGWLEIPDWFPLVPYVDADGNAAGPGGTVRSVSQFDPRSNDAPGFYEIEEVDGGWRVLGLTIGRPWVYSRRPTPVLTGDDYDPTAAYEATDARDVVWPPVTPWVIPAPLPMNALLGEGGEVMAGEGGEIMTGEK